ncbi:phosphatidylserine decarboxylase [Campylobacter insulaenigrae]|uniref:Phosphatidylserine decarboxylase-related protein n=1 Tax=Campylobacter insulaenigrae TaxID=260714 RepID=A0ABY3G519_9BACT|nr:phosphatidylserine decarboxylase [Campylobacter insulaenigrae]MCR6570920.1 phosphatidylserine decarboxylase [Campylobacter insulaenigrae]MCR6572421.1 phosphatidylserine decarboxylase [Campylobacter insulaenigrae]MCR6573822.1 phosphatidylserine decarboxylase [Campylobacter insulaenigrae]MCR6575112.1 phosphatidylserine decarboxylase [Campylobacter insulaenigrae]MCR6577185.1 phosphatidylserine decarboxylase [Campylobacter insulaenigrae]
MKFDFIAKAGLGFLISLAIVFAIIQLLWGFSWILCFILVLFLYIFRVSSVGYIADSNTIISPIEGVVKKIQSTTYAEIGECVEIQIFNSIFSQGTIIAPLELEVSKTTIKHGLFLCPFMKNTNLLAERILFLVKSKNKLWAMRITFGALNRKTHIYDFGHHLNHAQKIGFMLDGSISLFLPKDSKICVNENDKVHIGALIGYLNP